MQSPRSLPNHALRALVLMATAAGVVATTGCGSGHAKTSARSHPAAPAATSSPTASTPPSLASSGPRLTGFGATVADWRTAHVEVSGYSPGSVYDADPALPHDGGRLGNRYVTVLPSNGRVTMYQVNFPLNTSTKDAIDQLRYEFPSDVTIVWQQEKDTCYQVEFKSPALGLALADPKVGDPQGMVLVALSSRDIDGTGRYLSGQVAYAVLLLDESATAEDAPGC